MTDNIDKTILNDFIEESLNLVQECIDLLEEIEQDPAEVEKLNKFANLIDRVMGGAKSLAINSSPEHALHLVGDYCAICKSVGYQGAKIKDNDQLYFITTALLLDAVEMVRTLLGQLESSRTELKKIFTTTFLDRLKWVSFQFGEMSKKASGQNEKLKQNEIDELLSKLGL